jgi:hypothetical protein
VTSPVQIGLLPLDVDGIDGVQAKPRRESETALVRPLRQWREDDGLPIKKKKIVLVKSGIFWGTKNNSEKLPVGQTKARSALDKHGKPIRSIVNAFIVVVNAKKTNKSP